VSEVIKAVPLQGPEAENPCGDADARIQQRALREPVASLHCPHRLTERLHDSEGAVAVRRTKRTGQ